MHRWIVVAFSLALVLSASAVLAAENPAPEVDTVPVVERLPAETQERAAEDEESLAPRELPAPDGLTIDLQPPAVLACGCRDLCQSDLQCAFFCGSQGGVCVMVNSCCKECVCNASS